MRKRSVGAAVTAAALGGLLLAGCHTPAATGTTAAASAGAATSESAGDAVAELDALTIAADGPMAGYSRAQFGHGWQKQPDGCNSRVDVLADEAKPGTLVRHGCTVTGGTWVSLYDGVTVTSPHGLDVDHVVPLAAAWRTGARSWTAEQREAFANDVSTELIAVTAHSNRSKGDEAPPGYEPPVKAQGCPYAKRWVKVKAKYKLTVNAGEKTALRRMLGTCGR